MDEQPYLQAVKKGVAATVSERWPAARVRVQIEGGYPEAIVRVSIDGRHWEHPAEGLVT